MAIERKVDRDTKEIVDAREMCQRCRKYKANHLVDVKAAVNILVRACGRCTNQLLRQHPASTAVNLHKEYD